MRQSGKLRTPGKSRPVGKTNRNSQKYDDFTHCAIRRKVQFFFERIEPPTMDKLKQEIDLDDSLPDIPRSSLFNILKSD